MRGNNYHLHWCCTSRVSHRPCPACEQVGAAEILTINATESAPHGRFFHLLKCSECGSLFYEDENVVARYDQLAHDNFLWQHYVEVGAGIEAMIRPLTALGSKARGDLLDVGCGFGYAAHFWEFSGRGRAIGLETAAYGRMGREILGISIYSSHCAECIEIKHRKFDVVYASEVIEHVVAPLQFLTDLIAKLAPAGILVLTTPSADYISPRRRPSELIGPLCPGYHYFLLSRRALANLLVQAGAVYCVVKDIDGRLMAWASRQPLPFISTASYNWDEYFDYLERLAAIEDRSVAGGALYRLFKDSQNTGRQHVAAAAFAKLALLAQNKYHINLADIDVQRHTAAPTITDYLRSAPAWLGGALLFGGILNEIQSGFPALSCRMTGTASLVLQHEALLGGPISGEAAHFLPLAKSQYTIALRRSFSSAGAARIEKGLCLFAHYDRDGRIAGHVVHYVKELHAAGFNVVFISTAALPARERNKLSPYTMDIIVRENKGYDFGSWIEAYERYKPTCAELLLLCNDSVYGPFWDLRRSLHRLLGVEADFYGMVISHEKQRHVQSWFMLFMPCAHQSQTFREFMISDCAALSKTEVINRMEIGLTRVLEAAGFKSHALYDPRQLCWEPLFVSNPSHFLWRQLVATYSVPFIKVELLRSNPMRLRVASWKRIVKRYSADAVAYIAEHLGERQTSVKRTYRSQVFQCVFALEHFVVRSATQSLHSGALALAPFSVHAINRLRRRVGQELVRLRRRYRL